MRLVVYIAFLLLSGSAIAQPLTARWSTDYCMIGEQVVLTIQFRKAPKTLKYNSYSAEVPCELKMDSSKLTQNGTLEIIGRFSDTTYKKKGEQIWEGRYTLTAWDTGVYIFPLILVDPGIGDTIYNVQPKPLTVSFVKKKIGNELDEVPVIVETDFWWWLKDYWWIGIILLIVVSILIPILVLRIIKRNKRRPAKLLSLKDRTLIALEALRKQAYWKTGKITEHYMEFSFLLRSFLSARYSLNLMERTTYETVLLLRSSNVPEETLLRIRKLLQESDMVKFAMGIPDEENILLSMTYMEQLIIELSPLELVE